MAIGGLVVAALAAALAAQQANPPPPPQPPPQPAQPTFRTEANYVRVDVYPTKDGAPVADLRQDEFEVLESNAPQKIEQFERIVIRGGGPQETRSEPNTIAESRAMAESGRARLMVLFLDTYHVDVSDSYRIRKPLIESLDRMIGPDDMVAVMTPEMSARDITFARRTGTISGLLTRYWHWGERDRTIPPDPEDQMYGECYPNVPATDRCADQNGIAAEMIDRRHEKRALDALQDLVRYLRGIREERKAILAISNGWLEYRPNDSLMRPLKCHGVPTGPTLGIDPRTGRIATTDTQPGAIPHGSCDIDRMRLAQLDNEAEFRQILDEANRANASFYPIDPRGLAAFDTPMMRTDVPGPPPRVTSITVDRAMLTARLTSLRTLAEATDGLAIVDTNDLAGGFRRVVADLSSYYLLGYYSTGKLDGKFHSISVRVKRPGVRIRARRGYLAASTSEVNIATAAAAAVPTAEAAAEARAIETALAPLPGYARDMPLRAEVASGWRRGSGGKPAAGFWVVGEFGAGTPSGRSIDATLVAPSGASVARATSDSGARSVVIALTPVEAMEPGEYIVRVRGDGFGVVSVRVTLPPSPDAGGAVFFRRGQTTGNQTVATADRRFRRTEQLRVEMPMPANGAPSARLLDRTGKPLSVPVNVNARDDSDGTHWQTAQLTLAPLAPSDYIIEIANGPNRTMIGFRVVP
jgi:VWFA-related protein